MRKIACITLDVEADYGQDHISSRHLVDELILRDVDSLSRLFGPLDIKLTAFVVGALLEETPTIVDSLNAANAEVELHSFSHSMTRHRADDVLRGIEVFEDVLGHGPMGYRAPQGAITQEELQALDRNGVQFDSSVFPFFRPGKFSNFLVPQEPYFINGTSMLELPFASVPLVRLPISLSYMMLLGWDFYKMLFRLCGMPEILVFDFHLHDLFPSKSFCQLSKPWQFAYSTIYRRNPWKHFTNFVNILRNKEYDFLFMKDLCKLIVSNHKKKD